MQNRLRCLDPVNWQGVISLIARELKREWRFFGVAIMGPALQAALFAAVFQLAAGGRFFLADGLPFFQFLAPGLIMAALMQRAFEATAYTVMFDKMEASLEDLLGAPMTPAEILIGWIVSGLIIALLIGLSVVGVMMVFGLGWPQNFWMAGWMLVWSAAFCAILGVMAGQVSDKWDSLSGKETFILVPLVYLSGTFFPLDALPAGEWQLLFTLNPIAYMVDGLRYAWIGQASLSPAISLTLVPVVTGMVWCLGYGLFKSGFKIKP